VKKWDWLRAETAKTPENQRSRRCLSQFFRSLEPWRFHPCVDSGALPGLSTQVQANRSTAGINRQKKSGDRSREPVCPIVACGRRTQVAHDPRSAPVGHMRRGRSPDRSCLAGDGFPVCPTWAMRLLGTCVGRCDRRVPRISCFRPHAFRPRATRGFGFRCSPRAMLRGDAPAATDHVSSTP
jgi:hypothetical protein